MTNSKESMADAAMERDPRSAPFGIFTGGSFALDSVRVFCWFDSLDALADYLASSLPLIYDFDDEYTSEYQERIAPLLSQIRKEGFSEGLREQFNQYVKDDYVIDWWGVFDELLENETEFARNISSGFLDEENSTSPIESEQLDEFVEYLQTCGV